MGTFTRASLCFGLGLFILIFISPAHCQSSSRKLVIADLNKVLHFVISPNAKPTEELINVAMVLGGQPRSLEERILYLQLMQQIARNTSDVVKVFTTTVTNPDGTTSQTIDVDGINFYVRDRARLYIRNQRRERRANTLLAEMGIVAPSATVAPASLAAANPAVNPPGFNIPSSATSNKTATATGVLTPSATLHSTARPIVSNQGTPQGQTPVPSPAATMGVFDLFGIAQGSNNLGQTNNDLLINTTPMFFF